MVDRNHAQVLGQLLAIALLRCRLLHIPKANLPRDAGFEVTGGATPTDATQLRVAEFRDRAIAY